MGMNMNMPRTGQPCKLSPRWERKVTCMAKVNPAVTREAIQDDLAVVGVNVCQCTIINVLKCQGLASYRPRKVPLKTKRHLRMHLNFAKAHLEDSQEQWMKVLWSDETKIELFGHNMTKTIWHKKGEAYNPKNTIPTVKHRGDSVMMWGCLTGTGTGCLVCVEGKMNATIYQDILSQNLMESAQQLSLGCQFVFQQDNDLRHTAKKIKA